MQEESGEGRPQGELTTEADKHDKPHEELVATFRKLLITEEAWGDDESGFPPGKIIRDHLLSEAASLECSDPRSRTKGDLFFGVLKAWDVITFEHYPESSPERRSIRRYLSHYYEKDKSARIPDPEVIRLSSLQTRILDALTEAAGIPHKRLQAHIRIPSQLLRPVAFPETQNRSSR